MTTTLGSSFHVGPDHQPDKYRLLQQVGRGGEAQLWQGELSVAGGAEPVAIKMRLQSEGDFARSAQRWNEQAELLRFIRHPGVVGVREHFEGAHFHLRGQVGETRERALYLVMNWVDGVPLHEWALLHRDAPDRLTRAIHHLEQVADVLDWLHSGEATPSRRPVIHGDLSPGNVMVLGSGQAMLVDFGLVRVVSHQTQRAAGTPGYAAPEVWHSGDYSPAADRYAFGAVAWFALTGDAPPVRADELRARLLSLPLVATLSPHDAELLGSIFAEYPDHRPPRLLDWMRLLRRGAMTSSARPASTARPASSTWQAPRHAPPSTYVPAQSVSTASGPALSPMTPMPPAVTSAAPMGPPPRTGPERQPAVRPEPQPARKRKRWGLRIGFTAVVLVAAMVGGMVLQNRLFGTTTSGTSGTAGTAGTATAGAAPARSTPSSATTPASGVVPAGSPVAPLDPVTVTVRRETGADRILLTPNYNVDLDSLDVDWEIGGNSGQDVHHNGASLYTTNGADLAPATTTTPDFAACQKPLPYGSSIKLESLQVPASYCVRTSERRYAFVTVLNATGPAVLDVTVWDPPRPA